MSSIDKVSQMSVDEVLAQGDHVHYTGVTTEYHILFACCAYCGKEYQYIQRSPSYGPSGVHIYESVVHCTCGAKIRHTEDGVSAGRTEKEES